ncbi:CinA family protein [Polycladidibacter stylochi]|uniref:CinA family protein n=1 Tax=Polycladidibacter stylochi TaxID=1807766 RepID=UPI00083520D6|nr:CinA family protein [Pseudovibrio stylochi]
MLFDRQLTKLAEEVIIAYKEKGWRLATAESCTGGLLAGLLTDISGSSAVVERGFVTYSNEAKVEMISVPMPLIIEHGAVSAQVAKAMATGALNAAHVDVAVSITGIAGPSGGSEEKPVGTVHLACASKHGTLTHAPCLFENKGRDHIRMCALQKALELLKEATVTPKPYLE